MKHNPDKTAGPTRKLIPNNLLPKKKKPSSSPRRKLGAEILCLAAELEPVFESSCHAHAELVLSGEISEIMLDILGAPNAEDAAKRLAHWIEPIPSRGRKKLRAEARVFDCCKEIIATMPTNLATRRILWATVGRVRRAFGVIACHGKSRTPRSKYAKIIVVSYFWMRDYWCGMTIAEIAHTLGVRRQALYSARIVLNEQLPPCMRFPKFSEAV